MRRRGRKADVAAVIARWVQGIAVIGLVILAYKLGFEAGAVHGK